MIGQIALGASETVVRLAAFGTVAAVAGGLVAAAYRWYSRRVVPLGATALAGTGVVALYLQTVGLYGDIITGTAVSVFRTEVVAFNLVALLVGAFGGAVGRSVGDRVAVDLFAVAGGRELEADVGRLVGPLARVTTVTLPDDVETLEGYDPVGPDVVEEMAGRTLLFPRRLSDAERHDRLVTRIKEDHDVAHVDVELDDDGTVTRLAVGGRLAGIGATLAPGTVAVAVRADPAAGASPGDTVYVWRSDPVERVCTAELRAVDDEVATLAVDRAEAEALDPSTAYRLVTLPATPRADRAFAAAFRAADETFGIVAVRPGSDLDGATVGDVDATVVAVRPEGGAVEAIPGRARELAAGDTCYVVARADAIRRLEGRATVTADA